MFRVRMMASVFLAALMAATLPAQIRETPKAAKGGKAQGEALAEVPDLFKKLIIPEWPLPTDLKKWQKDRLEVRKTLLLCLGNMPPRPNPLQVKIIAKEEKDGYTLERFEFFNGVDAMVPGIILIPKDLKGPAPTIIGAHGSHA